jgi:hypothetical protein
LTEPIGTHRKQSAFVKDINPILADDFLKGLFDTDYLPKGFDDQYTTQVHSFYEFQALRQSDSIRQGQLLL